MTLALAILASIVATALIALWAARTSPRWRPAQTLLAALAPLVALAAVVRSAPARGGAHALRVVGQYAPLGDTVSLGGPGTDVRLPVSSGESNVGGTRLRLWYDHVARGIALRVDSGVALVTLDGRPVNAAPLGHGTRITLANRPGLEIASAMPAWPVGCLTRIARFCDERLLTVRTNGGDARSLRVRVTRGGLAARTLADGRLARAPFVVVSVDRRAWVVASPTGPVRVDGKALPSSATAPVGDASGAELRVGVGALPATIRLAPDTLGNRLALHFVGRTRGDRWPLATDGRAHVVNRVVASTEPGPGTLRLIDMDDAAPLGPRARPYTGAIEAANGEFRWHAAGRTRVLRTNAIERLPGTGAANVERGHLVEIGGSGARDAALFGVGAVWIAGALLLALAAATTAEGGAVRIAVLGLVYTIALVRVAIAWRVSAAPPYNGEALPWAALFLAAFPLLVYLLARWPVAWTAAVRETLGRERLATPTRRAAHAIVDLLALTAVAGTLAAVAGPLRLSAAHASLGIVVVAGGALGLLVLQRVLVAGEAGAFVDASPIGMLMPRAERGFGARQVWRAFTALLVVLGLYVGLAWSIKGVPSPLLAVGYGGAVAVAYAFAWARERVRPRADAAWLARWIGGAAVAAGVLAFAAVSVVRSGGIALPLAIGTTVAIGAAAAGWIALLPLVRPLRGWPYRADDVLPPRWFAVLPVLLIVVAGWTGLRRVAITLGYALAVAALLVVVRVFAAWWHRETGRRVRAQLGAAPERVHAGLLLGPLAVPLVVYLTYGVVDRGLLLLLLAAVLVAVTIAAATVGRLALVAAFASAVLVLGVVVPRTIAVDPVALGTRQLSLATPQMRWAAIRAPEALGHQLALAREEDGREIVATLQQDWGMRAHAALGGTRGGGLFSLPFGGAAITEEVSLTDNAFSVWVLAEHGFAGGAAVLGAYLALALVLLGAAHAAARRVGTAHLALLLAGIAAYLMMPALYMAAANVGLVPLTGQNFPLLGLRSGADVAFVAWLAALAVVALPKPAVASDDDPEREDVRRGDLRRLRLTLGAAGVVAIAATAIVASATWRATHAEVAPFALDAFADDLRELVRRGDLVRSGDTLAVAAASAGKLGLRDGDLVHGLVRRSNAFARGTAAPRLQCLDRGPWLTWSGEDVRVNDTGCRVGGPATGERWRGALTAGRAPRELSLAGLSVPVVLGESYAPRALVRCDGASGGETVHARAVEIACGDAAIEVAGGAHPTARLVAGGPASLDGAPLGGERRALGAGAVLALGGATLVVDSVPGSAMAFARWRNGAVERVTAAGTPPLLVALDSVLARTVVTGRAGERAEVAVTLDVPMQRALSARLAERCAALGAGAVRRCSAIVVDPTRGDVLALASWERPGLSRPAYEPVDANFRAHRPGSVVKPILASAVLARYPRLVGLGVAQPTDSFDDAAGWSLGGRPMHAARNGCTDATITWHCFLPNSNNRFAVTLGLFGLAEEPASGDLPVMGDAAQGTPMTLDGAPLVRRPRLPAGGGRPASWLASPLARNLALLYDVRVGMQRIGTYDDALWRAARDSGVVRGGATWQRVSPALPELPIDDRAFGDLRHVAGFLIGETDHRWSNAGLARAMSRLLTGRAVELRLLRRVGHASLAPARFDTLPFGAGREAVLDGMRGVVRGHGTAREVAALFAAPDLDLVGKTGTLESDALEPLSAFMWGGRTRGASKSVCPAAGIVVVELEPGAAERLRAAGLFADAVAPALRETFGWGSTPCARGH